jgi:hypothetical protein
MSIPTTCRATERNMSEKVAASPYLFTMPRDVIFHVLYGVDMYMILGILSDSAVRICAYTGTYTAMRVFECAKKSLLYARAVFVLFLSIDSRLRECVAKGNLGDSENAPKHSAVFQVLSPFKTERLFLGLQRAVVAPWIRHSCNTPSDLVTSFESEYLCS